MSSQQVVASATDEGTRVVAPSLLDGVLNCVVLDAFGAPVADAGVTVIPFQGTRKEATTDVVGSARLVFESPVFVDRLIARKSGGPPSETKLWRWIDHGDVVNAEIGLSATVTVCGRVVLMDGQPVQNAVIAGWHSQSPVLDATPDVQAISGHDGTFCLDGLYGEFSIIARADRFECLYGLRGRTTQSISADQGLTVVLAREEEISGSVTAQGAPLKATVLLTSHIWYSQGSSTSIPTVFRFRDFARSVITASDGRFSLNAPSGAGILVEVNSPGYLTSRGSCIGPVSNLNFELVKGIRVFGKVFDQHGSGLASATVYAGQENDYWKQAVTDSSGNFMMEGLPGGENGFVMAEAPGFSAAIERRELSADARVDVTLSPGLIVLGEVVSREGRGIGAALVRIDADELTGAGLPGRDATAVTNANGAFAIEGLKKKEYVVSAYSSDGLRGASKMIAGLERKQKLVLDDLGVIVDLQVVDEDTLGFVDRFTVTQLQDKSNMTLSAEFDGGKGSVRIVLAESTDWVRIASLGYEDAIVRDLRVASQRVSMRRLAGPLTVEVIGNDEIPEDSGWTLTFFDAASGEQLPVYDGPLRIPEVVLYEKKIEVGGIAQRNITAILREGMEELGRGYIDLRWSPERRQSLRIALSSSEGRDSR